MILTTNNRFWRKLAFNHLDETVRASVLSALYDVIADDDERERIASHIAIEATSVLVELLTPDDEAP
jgi:tellurite resistance protein